MNKYSVEIDESEYSVHATCCFDKYGSPSITLEEVIVTVAGVEFDVMDVLPMKAWDKLYDIVERKFQEDMSER